MGKIFALKVEGSDYSEMIGFAKTYDLALLLAANYMVEHLLLYLDETTKEYTQENRPDLSKSRIDELNKGSKKYVKQVLSVCEKEMRECYALIEQKKYSEALQVFAKLPHEDLNIAEFKVESEVAQPVLPKLTQAQEL